MNRKLRELVAAWEEVHFRDIYMCVCVCVYIYIYIYIYRERERGERS